MTQKEKELKELLLKDLSARLPYGIKAEIKYYDGVYKLQAIYTNGTTYATRDVEYPIETYFEDCKPYLFPMSSMTEEQKKELCKVGGYEAREEDCGYHSEIFYYNMVGNKNVFYPDADDIDWLNKNHFDYRGLIEKGLAIDATGLNIY